MMVALIHRIHDRGLPSTQAELVAEMQDWFADQTGWPEDPRQPQHPAQGSRRSGRRCGERKRDDPGPRWPRQADFLPP
jgi:hypothetical protein